MKNEPGSNVDSAMRWDLITRHYIFFGTICNMQKSQITIPQHYKYYLGFLIVINLLPFIAPILMQISPVNTVGFAIAKAIYFLYSFSCHQFDTRSLHIFDHQVAWCVRDVAIWLGILTGAVLVWRRPDLKIRWYWVIIFILPVALDGGIQTVATITAQIQNAAAVPGYLSNNFLRFVTGSWFGLGMSLYLSRILLTNGVEPVSPVPKIKLLKTLAAAMAILAGIYLALILLWTATSTRVYPTNILDSIPKIAQGDFYTRRKNAICPTDSRDLTAWNCFAQN